METEHFKIKGDKSLLLFNMDEVPVFYDMRRKSTYNLRGIVQSQLLELMVRKKG